MDLVRDTQTAPPRDGARVGRGQSGKRRMRGRRPLLRRCANSPGVHTLHSASRWPLTQRQGSAAERANAPEAGGANACLERSRIGHGVHVRL